MKTMLMAALTIAALAVGARADDDASTRAQTLATRYDVPVADVTRLRSKGLGWGEINNALAISRKSGQPLSAVMALRQDGMGWGQIAQKYGLKLGEVVGKGHDAGVRKDKVRDNDDRKDREAREDRDARRDRADRAERHEGRAVAAHGAGRR